MNIKRYSAAVAFGIAGLCVGLIPLGIAQQSQPVRPVNPKPQPVAPTVPDTSSPRQLVVPPGATNPAPPINPNDPTTSDRARNSNNLPDPNNPNQMRPRNARPFAFQNPTDEARFNEGSQRLVRMEQKCDQSNQMLLRRLGEIRQMSPERQSVSTMDLLQQMLKSQSDMQQYLVSSRAMWTGDVELSGQTTDGAPVPATQDQQPATQQPAAPQQPLMPR